MAFLIIGGAKSGKSRYSEKLAEELNHACGNKQKFYIATAQAFDDEMVLKIKRHQEDRKNANWILYEEPLKLTQTIIKITSRPDFKDHVILVDCLTLWLSNLLEKDICSKKETKKLTDFLAHNPALKIIFVSNEVGLGLVPATSLGRKFRDQAGLMSQAVAKACSTVTLITAGLPLSLKKIE